MIDAIETVIGKGDLGMTGTAKIGTEIETETIIEAREVSVVIKVTEVSGTTPGATVPIETEVKDHIVRKDLTTGTGIAETTTVTGSTTDEAVTATPDLAPNRKEKEKERRASARK